MNKILSALLVGFFAVSVNAFAADAASAEMKADAAPAATMEKHTAAPAKKHHHHKKSAAAKAAAAKKEAKEDAKEAAAAK